MYLQAQTISGLYIDAHIAVCFKYGELWKLQKLGSCNVCLLLE